MKSGGYKACISCGKDTKNRCKICKTCLSGASEQERLNKTKSDSPYWTVGDFDRDDCVSLDVSEAMREAIE